MKIVVYMKSFRLKASPSHGGQKIFLNFLSPIHRWGAPSGAAAFIVPNRESGRPWTAGQSYQPYEVFPATFNLLDNTTLMQIVECGAHR